MGKTFLFVLWAGGGNVNPFLGLAQHLIAAGYSVEAVATGSLPDRLAVAGIAPTVAAQGWLPSAVEVQRTIADRTPDVVVVDYMLTGALCAAEAAGVPTVALVHTLYGSLLVDGTPHPMCMAGSVDDLNDQRSTLGLEPVGRIGDLLDRADRVIVTAPRELDDLADQPPNMTYVGPLFEPAGPDAGWSPSSGDGPLIVASVGTAGDPAQEVPLLGTILAAIEPMRARGFVTVADYVDRSQLTPPTNVTVSGYVRHAAVLPHADLLVTHAGLGSVTAALAHGVPMVCLPLDREQPDNARAVERIGAGVALEPTSSPGAVRAAIETALGLAPVHIEPTPGLAVELVTDLER